MKSSNFTESAILADNATTFLLKLSKKTLTEQDLGIGLLVADMFDELASGKDRYMILGATTNKSAFSLTVKGPGAPSPIYAVTFAELSRLAHDLL